ncbi:hypothetical protein HY310_00760 [Candidatus Microgenomates bacterium]|nr:hypothetical protein [Candidatus Microgenomates bacterium]
MSRKNYHTSSLALAAAIQLISSESRLQEVQRAFGSNRAVFVFNESADLSTIIELFWERKLRVDALSFFDALKVIKSRLYEEGSK